MNNERIETLHKLKGCEQKKNLSVVPQRVPLEEDEDTSLSSGSLIDCNKDNGTMLMEGM